MNTLSKSLCLLSVLALGACKSDVVVAADGAVAAEDGSIATADGSTTEVCETREVPCVDTSISMLDLFDAVATEEITEEGVTEGEFSTLVDSTGGGLEPTHSFVYARFTEDGLTKVEIDDEAAFDSSDWDIAFRRYVVRINSGVAGPSCVQAARTAPGTVFADVTSAPSTLTYHSEEYFTDTCDFVPDGSGIGAPSTVLSSFWEYPGCVKMTGNVYIIALTNGRHVKFEVKSYYSPENQASCDADEGITSPSGAGALRVHWAFVD